MTVLADNPSAEEIHRFIIDVLSRILNRPVSEIAAGATLDGDLRLESVAFVELQVWLEDELGIEIDPVAVVELNGIVPIAEYLHSLVKLR